jgi:hypothetical protein
MLVLQGEKPAKVVRIIFLGEAWLPRIGTREKMRLSVVN